MPAVQPQVTVMSPKPDSSQTEIAAPAQKPTEKPVDKPVSVAALPAPAPAPPLPPAATPEATPTALQPVAEPAAPAPVVVTKPPAATAPPEPQTAPRLPPDEIAALVARGDAFLGARLFYERAAEADNGQAALLAGETFDPSLLARTGLRGVRGDADAAAAWYRRAMALGAPDAETLLKALESR
jgi:hypothetical protein